MALPVIAAPLLLGLLPVSGMALPVIAAPLLLGLLPVSGASGEDGASRRCVEVQGCFQDCIGSRGDERFELNGEDCAGENAAGGCCQTFCGNVPCNVEITVTCAYSDGQRRPVNHTWTECEEQMTAAPQNPTQTSAAPRGGRSVKAIFWGKSMYLGQKGLSYGEVLAIIFLLAFLGYLIVHVVSILRLSVWKRRRETLDPNLWW